MLRERILSIGPPGSGKSFQWLRIARWLQPTSAQFRCLDTEDSIPRMLQTEFQDLSNVNVRIARSWEEYKGGMEWLRKESKSGDWAVVDMVDSAWDAVQRYFISEVFKEDPGDYFLEARKQVQEMKRQPKSIMSQALKGWVDWIVINKLYADFMLPLVFDLPCHLYLATKPQAISDEDDQLTKDLFGPYGVKPAGQKHLGHQVHTIFLLTHPGKGEWQVTTIKDRGRAYFDHMKLVSFPHQYLVAVAGWKL